MEAAELHATRQSYRSMHLSTHDKVRFYSHLGYVSGPKVSPLTKCMAAFLLTNDEVFGITCTLQIARELDRGKEWYQD